MFYKLRVALPCVCTLASLSSWRGEYPARAEEPGMEVLPAGDHRCGRKLPDG